MLSISNIIHDYENVIVSKCQYQKNVLNGYCLQYSNNKIQKAEKYINHQKIDEWHSLKDFKRDNKLSDLK